MYLLWYPTKFPYLNQIHVAINAAWLAVHHVLQVLAFVCIWSCMKSCREKRKTSTSQSLSSFSLWHSVRAQSWDSRWRKQSYLKQRLQKSVWKECRLCSLWTDLAFGPSMLGVHSGGRVPGSCCSVNSLYLGKSLKKKKKLYRSSEFTTTNFTSSCFDE